MANVIQKATMTLFQYGLIFILAKLFRIRVSASIFALILITGILVYAFTTSCNIAFFRAIKQKNRFLFKALLVMKVNVRGCDCKWRTPLHYAVMSRDEFMVLNLLKMPKVRINSPDKKGITPVMLALADPKLPLKVKEAFCNHPDFNIFYTAAGSVVPSIPSILLDMKQDVATADPQLEILLKMKLKASMEYLHWENGLKSITFEDRKVF